MAVLGLRFCARAFSSCGKRGPLFITVRGPLTIAASLVAEHRLQTRRLSNCGSRAQLLRGMWDLPRPGLETMSPALAGRFSTTAPPGKPPRYFLVPWGSLFCPPARMHHCAHSPVLHPAHAGLVYVLYCLPFRLQYPVGAANPMLLFDSFPNPSSVLATWGCVYLQSQIQEQQARS